MKIAYNHLLQYIEENPSIEDISNKLFHLGHEHEIEGRIFNMEFTPNRGDCLSLMGLLRDLAVFYTINDAKEIYDADIKNLEINFENQIHETCPQISFLKLEINGRIADYKSYLKNYFKDFELNQNNFFTDISNYILYETGQPTHCYDEKKLNGKLCLTDLKEEVKFKTLFDKDIKLTGKNSVFLLNDEVVNLAGVIGGSSTACSNKTQSVIVECAYFAPESIIGKSIKYDIKSDASYRFERGVDIKNQENVLRRFIKIVEDHVSIKNIEFISYSYKTINKNKIPFNLKKINHIIGTNINIEQYKSYLESLNFFIDKNDDIHVPSYRNDILHQNDLAEEIARVIGYDNIPVQNISIPKNNFIEEITLEDKIRSLLLDNGFYEVINTPFSSNKDKDTIKIDNPLDSNRKYLRTNLSESLLQNLLFNERRQKDSIKLFEIADVYSSKKGQEMKRKLAVIASGRVGKNYKEFPMKITTDYLSEILESAMPNNNFDISVISRDSLNSKIKSTIVNFEIEIDKISHNILDYQSISSPPEEYNQYIPISEFPSTTRDISYSIKESSVINILSKSILQFKNKFLKEVFIFDYYNDINSEEIKIGFRFIFQAVDKTLSDQDVDIVMNDIISLSDNMKSVEIPGLKRNAN